jgi:GntR family transcriptional regulator
MTMSGSSSRAEPYVTRQVGDAWAADAASQGRTGTQQLLFAGITASSDDVRQALRIGDDEPVVIRRRLILADGRPVEIATSHYPGHLAASTPLTGPGKIRGGAVSVLADLGHAPADVAEVVTARLPDRDEAETLQATATEPLIVLSRTSFDAAGLAVEYAVNIMVASRVPPLTYRFQVPTT